MEKFGGCTRYAKIYNMFKILHYLIVKLYLIYNRQIIFYLSFILVIIFIKYCINN